MRRARKNYLKKFKKPSFKKKTNKQEVTPSGALPRITNETVAEHREEVLSSARKYIYPLQHSKHKIVIFTITIVLASIVAFFTYCTLALYRFQGTSTFLYKATQVIPFPIARQGSKFIAYENYLFEVRRIMHYYENNQKIDFNSNFGKEQLAAQKQRALDDVINMAYIKQIAKEKNISVSDREVEDLIVLLRNQGRLGSSDQILEDVLKQFYGWTRNDLKRSLSNQLLEQKVLQALDTDTKGRADAVLAQVKAGRDFAKLAKANSDDVTTKDRGGAFAFTITPTSKEVTPQAIAAIFALKPGQTSGIVNIGTGLEIFKMLELKDSQAKVAHIAFNFKDINEFLNDRKEKQPTKPYIKLPEVQNTDPVL